jgi:hypothetical protein
MQPFIDLFVQGNREFLLHGFALAAANIRVEYVL